MNHAENKGIKSECRFNESDSIYQRDVMIVQCVLINK